MTWTPCEMISQQLRLPQLNYLTMKSCRQLMVVWSFSLTSNLVKYSPLERNGTSSSSGLTMMELGMMLGE